MNNSRLLLLSIIPLALLGLCGFKSKSAKPIETTEIVAVTEPPPPVVEAEPAKPLDLSVPMKIEPTTDSQGIVKQADAENFVTVEKNKRRTLQLDGNILMSQELEAEKRKAVDGAGIVLRVAP